MIYRPDQLDLGFVVAAAAANGSGISGNYTDIGFVVHNNYDVKLNTILVPAQVFVKFSQMNGKVYSDMWLRNPPDGSASGAGSAGLRRDTKVGSTPSLT
jgi:hypothetical protein